MALSAEEYTELRQLTGGVTNTNDKDHLTDAQLQAIYDNRAGADWDLTIVHILRRRLGMASVFVDKTMDLNSESLSQRREALKELLELAEAVAGVGGYTLEVGTIDLDLDTESSDVDEDDL